MSKWAKKTPEGLYRANSKAHGLAKIGNQNRTNHVCSAVWKFFFSPQIKCGHENVSSYFYDRNTKISEGDKSFTVLPFTPV